MAGYSPHFHVEVRFTEENGVSLTGNQESVVEVIQEELEALQAIYGEDLCINITNESSQKQTVVQSAQIDVTVSLHPDFHRDHCGMSGGRSTEPTIVRVLMDGNYPSSSAVVTAPSWLEKSQSNLQTTISASAGLPHLHLIIDWIKENFIKAKDQFDDQEKDLTVPLSVCKFYLEGKCRFGDKCFNAHPSKETKKCGVENSPEPYQVNCSKQELNFDKDAKDSVSPCTDSKLDIRDTKKKPMKTAADVISRIQWDPMLSTNDFVVGYLDRFVGIVERPFDAFTWENLASVDHTVLAIPKHRIQFFKYKGNIVWDKTSRTDRVFGSTGNGETILDVVAEVSDKHHESACLPSGTRSNDEPMSRFDVEMEDSDEDVHDNHGKTNAEYSSQRPNHFICFRIEDNKIKQRIHKVQKEVVSYDQRLEEGLIGQHELHVTLLMFRIENESEMYKVRKVLEEMQMLLVCMFPRSKEVVFDKLNNFRGRVLHVEVRHEPLLDKLVKLLMLKLCDIDIKVVGNYESYKPHVTIVKMNRPLERVTNTTEIYRKFYERFEDSFFGKQPISSLRFCSTGKSRGQDGFYETFGHVTNRLSILTENLVPALETRVRSLQLEGKLAKEQIYMYIENLHTDDEKEFDNVLNCILEFSQFNNSLGPKDSIVIIMRGLPGSGKSTFLQNSREFKQGEVFICSADTYFETESSSYKFDPLALVKAHKSCREEFVHCLQGQRKIIVIDNTNSQLWEYQVYKQLASLFSYKVIVLELPCQTSSDSEMYAKRCIHDVSPQIIKMMWKSWEEDVSSISLDCMPSKDDDYSLVELINKCSDTIIIHERGALYSALFLDGASKDKLRRLFPPVHQNVFADHMTLVFEPSPSQIKNTSVGTKHTVTIIGHITTESIQAVAVAGGLHGTIATPHITISNNEKCVPRQAAHALSDKNKWQIPQKDIHLTGTVGVQVAISEKSSKTITDPDVFSRILRQLIRRSDGNDISSMYQQMFNPSDLDTNMKVDIVSYAKPGSVSSLLVFDFDGTLFHSPRPEKGREIYERKTGKPWPHLGWLSHPASLEYPLQCTPGPAYADYKMYHQSNGSLIIVLTGRIEKMRVVLNKVLVTYGVRPKRSYLKPDRDDGHRFVTIPKFKRRVVREILTQTPSIKEVKVWDDREENLNSISTLKHEFKAIKFELVKVPSEPMKLKSLSLEEKLFHVRTSYGRQQSSLHRCSISTALHFIAEAWAVFMDIPQDVARNCLLPFGSAALGRQGDLDLCLIGPRNMSVGACLTGLQCQLEKRGVKHIYAALHIRCPRLKMLLHFSKGPPLNVDVVIACCVDNFEGISVKRDLDHWHKVSEKKDKIALEGLIFLKYIFNTFKDETSRHTLGALVDILVVFLEANHLKGNAFHCIRTFHVVKAVVDMVASSKAVVPSLATLAVDAFKYFTELSLDEWNELCGKFVPTEYCIRMQAAFQCGLDILLSSKSISKLFERPLYPPENSFQMTLFVESDDEIIKWRGEIVLEALTGTYIRKLLDEGLVVFPGPSCYTNSISFAVLDSHGSREIAKQLFREFNKDFAIMSNNISANIHVNIE